MDTSILTDAVTGDNDRGSSKKLTAFICLLLIVFETIVDQTTTLKANPHIFDMLIYLIIACLGLGVADKKMNPTILTPQPDQKKTTINIEETKTIPDS